MYAVGVSNMFELLGDESAPTKTKKVAPKKATQPKEQQKKVSEPKSQKPKGKEQGSRSNSGRARQSNRLNGPRSADSNDRPAGKPNNRRDRGERKERSRRGDRNNRGNNEGKKNDRALFTGGGQRQFDRRSGTGRSRGEKKSGGGARNWGKPADELNAVPESNENNQAEESEAKAAPKTENEATAEPVEVEKPTMSYEEYLESLKTEKVTVDLPAARKAGEGEDNSKWAKYNTVLSKKSTETEEDTTQNRKTRKKGKGNKQVPASQVFAFANNEKNKRNNKNKNSRNGRGANNSGADNKKRDTEFSLQPESFPSLGGN